MPPEKKETEETPKETTKEEIKETPQKKETKGELINPMEGAESGGKKKDEPFNGLDLSSITGPLKEMNEKVDKLIQGKPDDKAPKQEKNLIEQLGDLL